MTDSQIIALFWERNEDAIQETDAVYGRKLYAISDKILRSTQDAEESVSDTYMRAWETIPPQKPNYFFAYLAKICRNFSLSKLQWNSAAKRTADIVSLTQEMEACIPDLMKDVPAKAVDVLPDMDAGAAAAADFGVWLFQTSMEEGKNTLISPLSVLYALAMTTNGADGETLTQMEQVLGMDVDNLNSHMLAYLDLLLLLQ